MTPSSFSPDSLEAGARAIAQRLRTAGFVAYWAGGCVRDRLLGRRPTDYDIATNAPPEEIDRLFPGAIPVGRSFGVMVVPIGSHRYEVATFRAEAGYRDGRHPDRVVFCDAHGDAERRDFTINALFYDVEEDRIMDFVGGQADLKAGLIRCVGDPTRRFEEDHLRMLRAVRLAGTLGFCIEPRTAAAIQACAPLITRVAAERIQQELTRLLTESLQSGEAVRALARLGLLRPLLPEVEALQGVPQPPEFHPEGDVFTHTVTMLNRMEKRIPALAWAILLHDVGKPFTFRLAPDRIRFNGHDEVGARLANDILHRLRCSREVIDDVVAAVRYHMRLRQARHMRPSTLRRILGEPGAAIQLELFRLDCLASHGDLETYRYVLAFQDRLKSEAVLPPPWVRGQDLLALGLPQGPAIGQWKRRAYDAQLEGRFSNREALLEWLRRVVRQEGSGGLS